MTIPGSFYDQAKAGNLFIAMSTTPLAIPVAGTTAPKFVLWNRSTNTNCVLVRYTAGWSATTEAPGNIQFTYLNAGYAIGATGAPCTAFTDGTATLVTNGVIGIGKKPKASFSVAATIIAGTVFYGTGISHLTTTGAAITQTGWMSEHLFQETVIVPPGMLIHSCASAATATLYHETLVWYEVPA